MAKVVIEVDTETKSLDVSINGKKIEDVGYVSVYKYENYDEEEKLDCTVQTCTEDEEGGVKQMTNYFCHASEGAKKIARADAILDIPGFVGKKEVDPTSDLAKFFGAHSRFK